MSSNVAEVASLVARGYTSSGQVPGGRYSHVFFWPWASILACLGALGLLAASLKWVYALLQFIVITSWPGLS